LVLLVFLEHQDSQDRLEIVVSLVFLASWDFQGLQDHRELLERQDLLVCPEERDFQVHLVR